MGNTRGTLRILRSLPSKLANPVQNPADTKGKQPQIAKNEVLMAVISDMIRFWKLMKTALS